MKQFILVCCVLSLGAIGFAEDEKKEVAKPPAGPIQVTVKCDKKEYMHGEPGVVYIMAPTGRLKATLTAKNTSDKEQTLEFGGQKYDFVIRDAKGNEVMRWSNGKAFIMILESVSLAAGKELSYSEQIPLGGVGKPLPEGSYTLEAVLTCDPTISTTIPFKIIPTPAKKP